MLISFGNASTGSTTRYEVAWYIPQLEIGGAKGAGKSCWLLESSYTNLQAACVRLEEIQKPLCARRGSVVVYEVSYDDANKIVSERVVARRGGERPPFRHNVLLPDSQVRTVFAALVRASAGLKSSRIPKRSRRMAVLFLAVAGIAAVTSGAVIFTRSPSRHDSDVARVDGRAIEAKAHRKTEGQILISRGNSDMCDRYLFDNSTGAMRLVDALPCGRNPRNRTEEVNSFSAGWRSGR